MSSGLDDDVRAAIGRSRLGTLPHGVTDSLATGARRRVIPAGLTVHTEIEEAPHLDLVVAGLVRVHVSAADGRTMTVRYCRAGALLGVATLYADVRRSFGVQAIANSQLLAFRPDLVRRHADRDPEVARALLTETSERVLSFVAELSGHAFSTVLERVARHLLDLASDEQRSDLLIAPITQQELADAVGTVREVVVRTLRDLRRHGVIETGRDGIVIRDAVRLARMASPDWNEGS